MRKQGGTKIPDWERIKSAGTNWFLSSWKFSCLLVLVIPLQKQFLCSNLIVFLLPLLRTCFTRSFLPRHCYFSFTCALRFFNHTSITKQTNKFRAYAADTNIDMSYEIQRGRERLWTLIHNICTGQDAQQEHPSTKSLSLLSHPCICWNVSCLKRGKEPWQVGALGQMRIKWSLLTVKVLNAMIYEAKVGPVEVSRWISRGICLAVLAVCCTLGSDVCITLLTSRFPLRHPPP